MVNQYRYKIITFGCQMNKSDSERIVTLLENLGYKGAKSLESADLVIFNTCSVRQSAEDRVYGQIRNLKKLKKKNSNLVIVVTGCMAGRDIDGKIRKKMPDVDLFFPTVEIINLPKWLTSFHPEIINSGELVDDYLKINPRYNSAFQAFVPISNGCNNFCTYCVVPFGRGREVYRSVKDILDEVRKLDDKNYKEITLLGQVVNRYLPSDEENFSQENPYQDNFARLLWEVNQFKNIQRIHFTAAYPRDINDEIIDALTLPKQVNYLHLPVQSGDNEVLKRMNRQYTREDYLAIIKKLREKKPNIALGTDIIVGFCGEDENAFQNTIDLYKEADFDISYNAIYSSRSGTVADKKFKDDVSLQEKKRRWKILHKLMEEIVFKKNQKYDGQEVLVLIEKYKDGFCYGNSREMKLVKFSSDKNLVGEIVKVKINKAEKWILYGNLVK